MKKQALFLPMVCLLSLPLSLLGQQGKLTVGPVKELAAKPGGTVVETLRLSVLPGFHVNSDKPKDEFLIPLKLTWDGPLETESIRYPAPEEAKVGSETLAVFTGTFEVQTQFKAPVKASPGPATMTGKLRYQACNNQMCFRPATIEVRVPVEVQ